MKMEDERRKRRVSYHSTITQLERNSFTWSLEKRKSRLQAFQWRVLLERKK